LVKNLSVNSTEKIILEKKQIHSLVKSLCSELNLSVVDLSIVFVEGEAIRIINKDYLQHDFTTDIISFNYSDDDLLLDGELFISVPDALENARNFEVNLDNELSRLVIHGILHLIGYDDIDPADKKIMKELENNLVSKHSKNIEDLLIKYDC